MHAAARGVNSIFSNKPHYTYSDIYLAQKYVWFYDTHTARKVFKSGVFSGLNTGKCGPEKTPYLNTFHTVSVIFL